MNYGIQKLQQGAGGLASAMLGARAAGGAYDTAYADTFKDLQAGQYSADRARTARAQAGIEEDRLGALQGLGTNLAPLMPGLGMDAALASNLGAVLRSGQGNAAQLMDALRTGAAGFHEQRAIDVFKGGNRDLANVMLEASGRRAYTPFGQSGAGSVINQATGTVDQSNPLAQSAILENRAQAGASGAAAKNSLAIAALNEVRRLTEGMRPGLIDAQTDAASALAAGRRIDNQAGPGGAKPTTSAREVQELVASGMDPTLARGIAYGTIKVIKDPMGMSAKLIDVATGAVVGEMDSRGDFAWNGPGMADDAPDAIPGGAPAGVPEASREIGGKSYVKIGGQWYEQ